MFLAIYKVYKVFDYLHITICKLRKTFMCDALRDSVTFALFKKREKHPWRSVTFSTVAGFQTKKVLPKLGYFEIGNP